MTRVFGFRVHVSGFGSGGYSGHRQKRSTFRSDDDQPYFV